MYRFLYVAVLQIYLVEGELKGRYTRDVKDYDVVVPYKVSENGDFISYYLPHYYNEARVRRGADTGKVHYSVPIGGSNKVLELLPSEDFHGPGLVIEHHDHDARINLGKVGIRKPQRLNCYYQGWVRNETSSSAAITTCSGLAGAITIGSNNFLIEPVEEDENPTTNPEHKHILYKREHEKHNRSVCGTKETFATAFKERMKWEERYGKETEKAVMGDDYKPQADVKHNVRSKKWCTTCKPKQFDKCQTPYPPCQVERPLFLELAIVIGPRVASDKYVFRDMEQYINTMINIAARHFQDSSLERPILIKLVRVITLGFMYEDLDPFRYDPEELLKRFCEWQMHFNPSREVHPNHHDFVLYLVKFGDCSGEMQGLTNMASICRPDKACGVVSLEGLLTAHVITHMLGHSMGADHDDENVSGCLPEEPDGTCYHMAQHVCTRSTAWSVCSRHCISKFTSTHAAWCMSDVPTSHDLTDPSLLPGQVYSAAEQCRLNFEMDTYACLVGEFCKHLFCKISDNECVSTGEPPAQGTRCGPDQWCFNQRCVHRGSRPGATNGEWGIWSQWTACTKTCGGGVQTANRACDSPPPTNGGRPCAGSWLKSRMCNIGACPDAGKGFLDQQCKNTNNKPYHGRRHEWLYFNQQVEDMTCVVMCVNERNEVAVRAPLAIDGTFCKPGKKDVCIRGMCRPVGCDWVIGSNAKEDACGVCHGNGTECKVMQGYFTEQNFQGRMSFLKLPVGTSMILMRETRPSPCFFVVANSLNSTYYLNSDDAEERTFFAGAFTIQSTLGIYQLKANMERIFIKDRLKVPITVSVVCRKLEPAIGILYQYALPESIGPDIKPRYTWEFLSWERCPHACGGAVQRAVPVCVEAQGGEVEDSYCSAESRPIDRIRVCNPKPCRAKWWVGPWSECDCYMKGGVKTRMVMCAHLKAARSSYITIVTEEECLGEDKPFSEKPCDKDAESVFWLKKGERKKRDYMDLVPYSKLVENYSVYDDSKEDFPSPINIRRLFDNIDPENVDDYVFMKKTGMAPGLWNKIISDDETLNARVRKRKAIIATRKVDSNEVGSENAKINEKKSNHIQTQQKIQGNNHEKQKELSKQSNRKEKEPAEAPNSSFKPWHEEVKKTEPVRSHEVRATTTKSSGNSITDLLKDREIIIEEAEEIDEEPEEIDKKQNDPTARSVDKKIGITKGALKQKNYDQPKRKNNGSAMSKDTQKTNVARIKDSLEDYFPAMKKLRAHKATIRTNTTTANEERQMGLSSVTRSVTHSTTRQSKIKITARANTGKFKEDSVKDKYETLVEGESTTKGNAMTTHPATAANRKKSEKKLAEEDGSKGDNRKENTYATTAPTTLTVPEVKIAPGLTPHQMYETETPAQSGNCWRKEIMTPRMNPTCNPQEATALEPAEDSPEWDYLNASNVKIYVVPIQTTIRTIIQNDNEFVLMETLAKYPVADEMNMVEHRGDSARRKLKIAAIQKQTTKGQIQD